MINSLLNALWPITPWVHSVSKVLRESPEDCDVSAFLEFAGAAEKTVYFDEEPFIISVNRGLLGIFSIAISCWPNGGFVVTSRYSDGQYALNWRERSMLRDAIEQFKQDHIARSWRPSGIEA